MIGGFGFEMFSTYSQTLNVRESPIAISNWGIGSRVLSGPFLVSRTGDAGCSGSWVKVPK
jgi:hypothetical protein